MLHQVGWITYLTYGPANSRGYSTAKAARSVKKCTLLVKYMYSIPKVVQNISLNKINQRPSDRPFQILLLCSKQTDTHILLVWLATSPSTSTKRTFFISQSVVLERLYCHYSSGTFHLGIYLQSATLGFSSETTSC